METKAYLPMFLNHVKGSMHTRRDQPSQSQVWGDEGMVDCSFSACNMFSRVSRLACKVDVVIPLHAKLGVVGVFVVIRPLASQAQDAHKFRTLAQVIAGKVGAQGSREAEGLLACMWRARGHLSDRG